MVYSLGKIRSNILCMNHCPSLDRSFSIVLQEEGQQDVTRFLETRSDPVGFHLMVDNLVGVATSSLSPTVVGRTWHNNGVNNGRGRERGRARALQADLESASTLHPAISNTDRQGMPLDDEQWDTLMYLLDSTKSGLCDRLSGIIIYSNTSVHLKGNIDL